MRSPWLTESKGVVSFSCYDRDPATSGASQILTDAVCTPTRSSAAANQPVCSRSVFELHRRTVMTDFGTRIGMIRRYGVFSALLLLAFFSTTPHGFSVGDGMKRSANAATAPNKRVANSISVTNASGGAISNYPYQFGRPFVDGAIANQPRVLINGQLVVSQADVKNRYPDGSVEFAVIAVVIPAIPASGSLTLTFQNQSAGNNTPLTAAQMLASTYDFDASMALTPVGGTALAASARTMLQNGDYKLWTSGPVAQTIMLGDDSAARKYDIGFGDGYHPFRPRFYATFWPATHQVFIRCVGENGLTTEVEDLAYKLSLTSNGATIYSADLSGTQTTNPKLHWALSRWTREFWIGGAPSAQINIDNNLAYLESTRFLPNFDTSIAIPQTSIAAEYLNWSSKPNDIYDASWDGGSVWINAMGDAGDSPHIGPYPRWVTMWLFTGDWRMRQMALGLADLAAAWPMGLRESDPTRRYSRADPVGSGTGLGRNYSVAARPHTSFNNPNNMINYNASLGDDPKKVGPFAAQPWTWDDGHQPSAWFPQYILTGDPWYLDQMYAWAGITAAITDGVGNNGAQYRGPSGAYGGVASETRAAAWTMRGRAETAFAAPDGSPEKTYFTYLTNDALARWEGGLAITGTPFDGSAEKVWGATYGNSYSSNNGNPVSPVNGQAPPLGNWGSTCPAAATPPLCGYSAADQTSWGMAVAANGSYDAPWMMWYVQYALGRLAELGFASQPNQLHTGQYIIGMIGSPLPILVAQYQIPVEKAGGGWWATWPSLIAGALDPTWVSGSQSGGGLPAYFVSNLSASGRQVWGTPGLAMLVDQNAPAAAAAWSWWKTNVYSKVPVPGAIPFYNDLRWTIVPRTDDNILPAQSTTMP